MTRIGRDRSDVPGGMLGKALHLSAGDWLLVGRAWIRLMAAQRDLRRRSYASIAGELAAVPISPLEPSAGELGEAARAVGVAARVTVPRATCLPRALVLCRMVREAGAPAEVRIGVRRSRGDLHAHAWVESDGAVVGDRSDIATTYSPLERGSEPPAGSRIRG